MFDDIIAKLPKLYCQDSGMTLYCGDCRHMAGLSDNSVHVCVTSPPYWGLRKYKIQDLVWGKQDCEHEWGQEQIPAGYRSNDNNPGTLQGIATQGRNTRSGGNFCLKCNAWQGQLGLEPSPELYVQHIVEVVREVKRVLRPDSTLWLNMGDAYNSGQSGTGEWTGPLAQMGDGEGKKQGMTRVGVSYLKPLDLCQMPFKIADALQRDGWYLRSTIVWQKTNPMPESVAGWRWERHKVKVRDSKRDPNKSNVQGDSRHNPESAAEWQDCPSCPKCMPNDGLVLRKGAWRPTESHEYIFMLTKTGEYFANQEAVREIGATSEGDKAGHRFGGNKNKEANSMTCHSNHPGKKWGWTPSRNCRTVWSFPTAPYKGAHFACVDEETECLTTEGWKHWYDTKPGMLGAQYDLETQRLSWGIIEIVTNYEVKDQTMIMAQNRDLKILLTPDHRCVIRRRHKETRQLISPCIVRADQLTAGHHIPTAAEWDEAMVIDPNLSEDWAELLGYYISEGHECRKSLDVEIYQSLSANPEYVKRIRYLLDNVQAEYNEATAHRDWRGKERYQTVFRIRGYAAAKIRQVCPYKKMSWDMVRWPVALIEHLVKGLNEGDGSFRGTRVSFVQKGRETPDIIQALYIRLGKSACMSERMTPGLFTVYLTHHNTRSFRGTGGRGSPPTRTLYSGIVWCPKLPKGTWLGRRQGRCFITGNTFPEQLVKRCLKASTSEAGVCAECGTPWAPVIERGHIVKGEWGHDNPVIGKYIGSKESRGEMMSRYPPDCHYETQTLGYRPCCQCESQKSAIPALVLDPFCGSGTVMLVASKMGLRSVGYELSEEYCKLAVERNKQMALGVMKPDVE